MSTSAIFVGKRKNCRVYDPDAKAMVLRNPRQAEWRAAASSVSPFKQRVEIYLRHYEKMLRRQMVHDGDTEASATQKIWQDFLIKQSQLDGEIDARRQYRTLSAVRRGCLWGGHLTAAAVAAGFGYFLAQSFDAVMCGFGIFNVFVFEGLGRALAYYFTAKEVEYLARTPRLQTLRRLPAEVSKYYEEMVNHLIVIERKKRRAGEALLQDDEDHPLPRFFTLRAYHDRIHDTADSATKLIAYSLHLWEIAERRYHDEARAMIERVMITAMRYALKSLREEMKVSQPEVHS